VTDWKDNEDIDEDYGPDDNDDNREAFADPGGKSALRAETEDNPRNLRCPTCNAPNSLTPADVARHYQCDACADRDEQGLDHPWYDSEEEEDDDAS